MAGSPGYYNSRNMYTSGVKDAQTGFAYERQLFTEMRQRTFIGALSNSGDKIDDFTAGMPQSLNGNAAILRKEITEGDLLRMTMREHSKGMSTYGDLQHPAGDAPAYKNMDARVNMINGCAIPEVGEMDLQRIRMSIANLPADLKEEVLDDMAEIMEMEALYALIKGASPSVLLPTTSGGFGMSLGINAGGGAGVPLMNRWFYTNDTGFDTYSVVPATWNNSVDAAVGGIDATIADSISLASLRIIRGKMDTGKWWNVKGPDGKSYKAICLIDPAAWWRLDSLLKDNYKYALPRGWDNPLYTVDYVIVYDSILYIPCSNLAILRPTYLDGSSGVGPTFGPNMTSDFRDYTNTSTNALCIFIGKRALIEGYNGSVEIHTKEGSFQKGNQIAARTKLGYVRGEWYAKDGRTSSDTVRNYSVMIAAFYEAGIGVTPGS